LTITLVSQYAALPQKNKSKPTNIIEMHSLLWSHLVPQCPVWWCVQSPGWAPLCCSEILEVWT